MSKDKKKQEPQSETPEKKAPEEKAPEVEIVEEKAPSADEKYAAEHDKYLRLAAEYDNYRKRSQREREAIYRDVKADTIVKLLPVYDNLERALRTETEDAAYKKGVELTMTQLEGIFESLGVKAIPAVGEKFDANLHNAVMHVEDEKLGESVIAEEFQKGFMLGDKVIRFSVVKVAN